jgi:hypothetical protein
MRKHPGMTERGINRALIMSGVFSRQPPALA